MRLTHPNKGHRQRLRDRFSNGGLSALSDYEILEMLINQSVMYADTQVTAKKLLLKFGNLRSVLNATEEELLSVSGIGVNTATTLRFFGACNHYLSTNADTLGTGFVTRAQIADHLFAPLAGRETESVIFICINEKFNIVYTGEVTQNKSDSVTPPSLKEIFTIAIKMGALYIYFAHNHPEGIAFPSKADTEFTAAATVAALQLGLVVLDHLIVTDIDSYSFFYDGKIGAAVRDFSLASKIDSVPFNRAELSFLFFPQNPLPSANLNKNRIKTLSRENFDPIITVDKAKELSALAKFSLSQKKEKAEIEEEIISIQKCSVAANEVISDEYTIEYSENFDKPIKTNELSKISNKEEELKQKVTTNYNAGLWQKLQNKHKTIKKR